MTVLKKGMKIRVAVLIIVMLSILGWIYECAFYSLTEGVFIRRGFGLGPWLPIYGVGAALYLFVTGMEDISAVRAFLVGFFGGGIVEYVTGWGLYHFANGMRLWDYNTEIWNWGNIGGYVCLRSVILFGVTAILVQKFLIPFLTGFVEILGERKSLFLSAGLSLIFIADIAVFYIIRPFFLIVV